ncbi:MAG: MAPEG family protein [Pseudomonadota bacterium]
MTTILICLLIGVLLPYVVAGLTAPYRSRQFGKIELNTPRAQESELTDAGHRASASQSNAWEALTAFGAANLMAHLAGVDPAAGWSTAAMIWAAARIVHPIAYIADVAALRVLAFAVGMFMNFWIVYLAFAAV